jgi:hypothetical protein
LNLPAFDRFYFGCGPDDIGHYFWQPGPYRHGDRMLHEGRGQPWSFTVDGGMQPLTTGVRRSAAGSADQVEGACALHRKDGWTAIAWWDRSKDRRGNSCSVYAQRGEHDFAAMVAAFRESFPWAAKRMGFELVEVAAP